MTAYVHSGIKPYRLNIASKFEFEAEEEEGGRCNTATETSEKGAYYSSSSANTLCKRIASFIFAHKLPLYGFLSGLAFALSLLYVTNSLPLLNLPEIDPSLCNCPFIEAAQEREREEIARVERGGKESEKVGEEEVADVHYVVNPYGNGENSKTEPLQTEPVDNEPLIEVVDEQENERKRREGLCEQWWVEKEGKREVDFGGGVQRLFREQVVLGSNPDDFETDASLERKRKRTEKVYLFNYFDDENCCKDYQLWNCESAIKKGRIEGEMEGEGEGGNGGERFKYGVDECLLYGKDAVSEADSTFALQNREVLNAGLGSGMGLWKPYLLFRTLSLVDFGDVVIYSDLRINFTDDVGKLLRLLDDRQIHKRTGLPIGEGETASGDGNFGDVVLFKGELRETEYTKRDAFVLLDCQARSECVDEPQALGELIIIRKSLDSLRFAAEYLVHSADPRLLTRAEENVMNVGNYPGYKTHNMDVSVLSLLGKKWRIRMYPDPSQYGGESRRAGQASYDLVFDIHSNVASAPSLLL